MSEPAAGQAAIIAVGTELTADGRPETNGTIITRALAPLGYEVAWRVATPDDESSLAHALSDAAARFELVVVTGGLGPTVDDVTREAVARAFGVALRHDERVFASIRARYEHYGRPVPVTAARQAQVPEGAEVLENDAGTAPGLLLRRAGSIVALLPGVPHEMERMLERRLLPRLPAAGGRPAVVRLLKVSGLSESDVQSAVIDLFAKGAASDPALTLLTSPGEVTVVVRGRGAADVERVFAESRRRLGAHVFTEDPRAGLETAAAELLAARGWTVATAESCTGGLLGATLTRVPGSSAWFRQGWITYSNEAKIALLGVEPGLIERHGAVSAEVADAMAGGARRLAGTDVALSITGIAGPDGGTAGKPVGLVYLSMATAALTRSTRHHFPGDRDNIRLFAVRTALNRLRLA